MKKNIFAIIGVLIVIVSTVLAAFTDIANDIPSLIGTAFGLGMEIIAVWKKSSQKTWLVIAAIVCAVIGGICCAFAGLSEATVTSLIIAIAGVVSLLISIFVGIFAAKKSE